MKRTAACCMALILLLGMGLALGEDVDGESYRYVTFGRFQAEADGTVRPLLWRVLRQDENGLLLLSERLLLARQADDGQSASWRDSGLSRYLNEDFRRSAFSDVEETALQYLPDGELVTVPSRAEMTDPELGFADDEARLAQGTQAALEGGLYCADGSAGSPYWLRSVTGGTGRCDRVTGDGALSDLEADARNLGVRPMILLSADGLTRVDGDGSKENPASLAVLSAAPPRPVTPAPTPGPTRAPTQTPTPGAQPTAEPTPGPTAAPAAVRRFPTAYADRFPELTEDGFLPDGEEAFLLSDRENGLWLYADQNLRVEIVRKADTTKKSKPKRWYEADIFVRDSGKDFLRTYFTGGAPQTRQSESAASIAAENGLVFALNSDAYAYRVQRNAKKRVMSVGVILRGGEVLYDDPASKEASTIPTRDILALYPDGRMEGYAYNEADGAALAARCVYDTLCFGPLLVRDGAITKKTTQISARQGENARSGIGLVEDGHYLAIVMEEGSKESKGIKLRDFAQLFVDKGCPLAMNLEGGDAAAMIFMGEYINENKFASLNRMKTEVLGIGAR